MRELERDSDKKLILPKAFSRNVVCHHVMQHDHIAAFNHRRGILELTEGDHGISSEGDFHESSRKTLT